MELKVEDKSKNIETLQIVFSEQEVSDAEENVVRKLANRVDIPGFRKGKVPKFIIKSRYPEAVKTEVIEQLASQALKSISDRNLLLSPVLKDAKLEENGGRLVFEIHNVPEVKVNDFSEMELKKVEKASVIDSYIEKRLEDLREKHAIVEPKEGAADYGDMVRVKLTINTGEKTIMDEKVSEYVLYEEDDRPVVTEVIGKKKGDIVEFTRTFEDSKEYHYKIEIEEVYKRTLLDIGDELAKTVNSEYENLEQLKAALENEGNEIYEKEMLDFLRKQALDQFVDLVEFDISDKTLDFLVDQAIEKMKSDREYEKMLSQYDNDEGKLRKALRDYYEWDLKMNYGIEKVARENDLKVTEEDLQAEADNLALSWGVSSERARSIVKNRENIRKELEWELLKRKVADLILNKAKVIEVKPEELAQKEDKEDKKEVDQSEE